MPHDDLSRNVYCILGMPVDAIDIPSILRDISSASANRTTLFISTPNLNFLVNVQSDPDFRESLLLSDLCPADGMPVVWIARLLGAPIKRRAAGSDIFDALGGKDSSANPLKVFLFGGAEGIAAAACRAMNAQRGGLNCVGSLYPGFGSIEVMSRDEIIDGINASDADFLVVALGARKGQLWLQRNHHRLRIPIRSHLGAVLNFQAAAVRRAPTLLRKSGLEWLWRIKEEPHLWRRYWNDGYVLLRLLITRILPLAVLAAWLRLRYRRNGSELVIRQVHDCDSITMNLYGLATARHVDAVIGSFRDALAVEKRMIIDFANVSSIDVRFLGLLLMLRKILKAKGRDVICKGLSARLKNMFRLHGVEFLLFCDKAM